MKVTINTFILLSFLLQVYGQNGGGGQGNNGGGGSGGIIRSKQAREKATKLREQMSIQHGSKGNHVRFCLDNDEDCNHMMQMKLNRLFEVDENGNGVSNKAQNFNAAVYSWSDPEYKVDDADNSSIISVRERMDARVRVGKPNDNMFANFSMTVEVYFSDTIIHYANDTINITAGEMKFSIEIEDWPWKDTSNFLSFGAKVKVKTRLGNDIQGNATDRLELELGNSGGNMAIERFELGDDMFIDSPYPVILDYNNIAQTVVETGSLGDDGIEIDWTFPHFDEHLHYDPVMGDRLLEVETSSPTSTPTVGGGGEQTDGDGDNTGGSGGTTSNGKDGEDGEDGDGTVSDDKDSDALAAATKRLTGGEQAAVSISTIIVAIGTTFGIYMYRRRRKRKE